MNELNGLSGLNEWNEWNGMEWTALVRGWFKSIVKCTKTGLSYSLCFVTINPAVFEIIDRGGSGDVRNGHKWYFNVLDSVCHTILVLAKIGSFRDSIRSGLGDEGELVLFGS